MPRFGRATAAKVSTIGHRSVAQGAIVAQCPNAPSICEIRPPSAGWHADQLTDAETQEQLRKLAAEYIERAAKIERKDWAGKINFSSRVPGRQLK